MVPGSELASTVVMIVVPAKVVEGLDCILPGSLNALHWAALHELGTSIFLGRSWEVVFGAPGTLVDCLLQGTLAFFGRS